MWNLQPLKEVVMEKQPKYERSELMALVPWFGRSNNLSRRGGETFRDLQESFDRLVDDMFNQNFSLLERTTGQNADAQFIAPRVDISENEKSYTISADMPGVQKKDLDVSFAEGTLTIKGTREREEERKDENYYRVERALGSFQRTLALPTDADTDNAEANFENGLLRVTIPKTKQETQKVKKITVK